MTYDSANNTLYTFGNNDLVANNPLYLVAISLQGVATPVAPVDATLYGGLAYDSANSTLYALSNADSGVSTLMSFDFSAQTFAPVAVLGTGFTGGLALNSADGNLYAIASADGVSWALDRIAPANGAVTTLGILAPVGNQAPLSYTGLSFYSDGNAYTVGNDSDGSSTLYRLTIGGGVTTTSIGQLGNNLTTPPSTQEGFTGGLAAVPVNVPGPGSTLKGSLVGISGDGSGTTYLNTIDVNGTASSVFEVYIAAPSGQTKPASGDFSNGFNIIASHTYAQVMTASITVSIKDIEPSQAPNSVLRSTATDGGTVTVVYPPPKALPAPAEFTAYQGYATGVLNLAGFTVPGGAATGSNVYSATINWNDGSSLDTGVVVISGTTIGVSGQHTYAAQGNFTPTVVLHDDTGGSATVSAAVGVVADLAALPAPAALTVFQGDATGILSLASFSIPAGLPGAGSASYTATIDWGDGGPTSSGTVQISGLTVSVSAGHTYTSAGPFHPTAVLQDETGHGSATASDALTVLADVSSQVHAVSSGPIYNPLTQLFNGNVTFTNTGATTLTGPFPLVFQGLPAGVTLANATAATGGVPYISDALATLPPGQSSTVAVQLKDPQLVPITYTLQIIDPSPSNPLQLVSAIDPSLISASAANESGYPGVSVSADGRYVAFESEAENLVPTPPGTSPQSLAGGQIYVRDTQTGTITLISYPTILDDPLISPDGRYVAFTASGGALVVHDMTTGTTSLIANGGGYGYGYRRFSANSKYLVFTSDDPTLVSDNTFGWYQVYEYDLQTGTTTLVSVNAAGTAATGGTDNIGRAFTNSTAPSVSADGRFVAFESSATNLTNDPVGGGNQIFVRDVQQGITTLVTVNAIGDASFNPLISADGSIVLFQTIIPNLRTSTSTVDIFVCNLQTATARLVGLIASSFNFSLPDLPMALSADGRYVVFTSEPNAGLAGMPVNTYVCDLQTGTTTSVNVNPSASRGAVSAPAPGV